MSNTITAYFKGRVGVAESVYQNDYGIVMAFDSIDLPAHFDCYFSRLNQEEALPGLGADNRVAIPNSILANPGNVTIHIPLHTGESDSEVEYVIYFKVIGRARPIDDGTPTQMTAIERALALLSQPITNIEEIVNEALAFTGPTFDDIWDDIHDVEADFSNLEAQFQTAVSALTVDSEVQNIRVGDDGITYSSAGEATRKQFSNVKESIIGINNGDSDAKYVHMPSDQLVLGSYWNNNSGGGTATTSEFYAMTNQRYVRVVGTVKISLDSSDYHYMVSKFETVDSTSGVTEGWSKAAWDNKDFYYNAAPNKYETLALSFRRADYDPDSASNVPLTSADIEAIEAALKVTISYGHEKCCTPEQFGAMGNGVTDDTFALQQCIDFAFINQVTVVLRNVYLTTDRLLVYGGENNTKYGNKIIGVSRGKATIIGNHDKPVIRCYCGEYLYTGELQDDSGANIEISNIHIKGNNKTNPGISFWGYAPNDKFEDLKISDCSNGIETDKRGVYLTQFRRVRIDNCIKGFYFPARVGYYNTSLLFDSCYVQGCEDAYTVAGGYINFINSCCDNITGICIKLSHFSGVIQGFGCETPDAKKIFDFSTNVFVTVVNPYTYGNFTDEESLQIDTHFLVYATFIGGTMGYDPYEAHDKLAGHFINLSDASHVEFVNGRVWMDDNSNFLANPTTGGDLCWNGKRFKQGRIPFIGSMDLFDVCGVKSAKIYYGMKDPTTVADNTDISACRAPASGDILLKDVPDSIAGWIVTSSGNNWGNSSFKPIALVNAGNSRPINPEVGVCFFDQTINKPIWYSGSDWRDSNGQVVL